MPKLTPLLDFRKRYLKKHILGLFGVSNYYVSRNNGHRYVQLRNRNNVNKSI